MTPESPAQSRATLRSNPVTRHPWLSGFGLLLVALVVLVLLWDWNWFKGPIERRVTAQTGREFKIDGNLDVDLGSTATISAGGLRFANAAWAREKQMANVGELEFDLKLWPLLRGDIQIPRIRLTQPVLHLQRNDKGLGNWVFGKDEGGDLPEFRNVHIAKGQLSFFDPAQKTDIKVALASKAKGKDDAEAPIAVDGGGRWNGNRFTIAGTAESPLELRDADRPYRIDLNATAGSTRARARGTLLDPLRFRDFDLKLALSGKNLADLYPLIGVATPDTPPFALDGRLTRNVASAKQTTWHYDGFTGKVGDSDLSGDAAVTTGGERPFFKADLRSQRLDLDDLAGFVGGAPQAAESTNPELAARAAKQAASARVLPDTPYQLERLRAMDADVRLRATRINAPKLPLDDMDAHLFLDNGLLRLEPLNFGVANGDIRSNIRMDARETPIRTRAQIAARKLELKQLMPTPEAAEQAIGRVSGDMALAGNGNSIAKMLGSANGDIGLGMGSGQISNLVMELAGLDIQEALKFLITKDRRVPIRCAWGDFTVKDGVMSTRGLAFDTTDTIIVGEGNISLRDETLDLKLRPRPKDRSLFVFRSPLLVDGSFKDPSFRPDLARVGLRGALALALGSIAPPAALLATFEPGGGKDLDCGGRYAR